MIRVLTKSAQQRAVRLRDKQYDGLFYFALSKTGTYCRPSCAILHAAQDNYAFFETGAAAELQGYEACKQCRPDRLKSGLSAKILDNIDAGVLNDHGIHELADSLQISERHLRRLVQARTGTSPLRLNQAKQLAAARLLITKSPLPIIEVAFKVGFSSLRQFNDVFKQAFETTPREMRKAALSHPIKSNRGSL